MTSRNPKWFFLITHSQGGHASRPRFTTYNSAVKQGWIVAKRRGYKSIRVTAAQEKLSD